VHRIVGEIALKSFVPDTEKAEKNFDHALALARQQQAKSWEVRSDEDGAALARSREAATSSRATGFGLRLIH
jgi:hypothetical protein